MINVDNKVKNIYYMLCYSFYGEQLNEKDESSLGEEEFENIYNLFSLLLCLILKKQIKKGLHKEYINVVYKTFYIPFFMVSARTGRLNLSIWSGSKSIVSPSPPS